VLFVFIVCFSSYAFSSLFPYLLPYVIRHLRAVLFNVVCFVLTFVICCILLAVFMPDLTYDLMSVQAVTLQKKRVSVQLLASAVDASLPAFAAVRPAAAG